MKTLVSALALSLALGATAVNAQQYGGHGGDHQGMQPGGEHAGRSLIMFTELDADTDGFITEAELTAKALERFTETDANGDGLLDADELMAAQAAMMERFQQNGNGNEDRAARFAERAERMITNMIKIADENDDDMISFEEQQAARPGTMFEKIDVNGDGKISEMEWHVATDHRGGNGPRGEHGPRNDR